MYEECHKIELYIAHVILIDMRDQQSNALYFYSALSIQYIKHILVKSRKRLR